MPLLSDKTRKFITGRRGQMAAIRKACEGRDNIVWVHSASYGEFEEARPVIAEMRSTHPEIKILVTFFSPSGYEYLKDDPVADWVFYMPIDTRRNAKSFLDAVRPVKVIVSISDYWLNFLGEIRSRGIDAYLISARFTPGMFYFKPFGFPYRKAFRYSFKKIFVKDELSARMLSTIGIDAPVTGDTRMDRVLSLAAEIWSDETVDRWRAGEKVFVAGSILPDMDEEMTVELVNSHPEDKFLIVPHEIDAKNIACLRGKLQVKSALYTNPDGLEESKVLIVDTVGILSRLYRYGFAAYVGAGFDGCPHSVIEPAAYGAPVSYGPEFGPQYHCSALVDCGGGKVVTCSKDLCEWYDSLKQNKNLLEKAGKAAASYCSEKAEAAKKINAEIWK